MTRFNKEKEPKGNATFLENYNIISLNGIIVL
jgi:hypothetical protein